MSVTIGALIESGLFTASPTLAATPNFLSREVHTLVHDLGMSDEYTTFYDINSGDYSSSEYIGFVHTVSQCVMHVRQLCIIYDIKQEVK